MFLRLLSKALLSFLFSLLSFTAFSQHGKKYIGNATYVHTDENYGSVTISYEYAFNGTQMKIRMTQVIVDISVIMAQNEPELLEELRNRGIMPYSEQSGSGVTMYYEGKVSVLAGGTYQNVPITGSVAGTISDYAFFDPNEVMIKATKEYYNKTKKNLYTEQATLIDFRITSILFNELERKIDAVRAELSRNKNRFTQLIEQATRAAERHDFGQAESALNEAKSLAGGDKEMNAEIKKLQQLIKDKKQESEQREDRQTQNSGSDESTHSEDKTPSGSQEFGTEPSIEEKFRRDVLEESARREREINRKAEAAGKVVESTGNLVAGMLEQDANFELTFDFRFPEDLTIMTYDATFGYRSKDKLYAGFDISAGYAEFSTYDEVDGQIEKIDDSGYGFGFGVPIGYRILLDPQVKATEWSLILGLYGRGAFYSGTHTDANFFYLGGFVGIYFMHFTVQVGYGTYYNNLVGENIANMSLPGKQNGGTSDGFVIKFGFVW